MMGQAPKSILVINVTRIGDTLLAVPALRALATAWPDARLTVLGHPKRVAVLENLPFLAEVGPITKQRAVFRGWLPGHKYDLALVYGHDEALLKYAFRVARRVVAFRQSSQDIMPVCTKKSRRRCRTANTLWMRPCAWFGRSDCRQLGVACSLH
jgi:hypothetical protein